MMQVSGSSSCTARPARGERPFAPARRNAVVARAAKKDVGGFRWDGANLRWIKDSRVTSDKAMVTIQPKTGVAYTVSQACERAGGLAALLGLARPASGRIKSCLWAAWHRVAPAAPSCARLPPPTPHGPPPPPALQAWPVVQLTLANEGLKSVSPAEAQALSRKGWTLVDVRLADKYEFDHPQVGARPLCGRVAPLPCC